MSVLTLVLQSDEEIVREYVSNGSDRAATAFVRKHQRFVYATALRYLQNRDDAEDASQEVFIKALGNLHKFRSDSNLKTWLYRITVNTCTNMLRKKKFFSFFSSVEDNEGFYSISSGDATPQEILEKQEFEKRFMRAVSKLPEKQRETFALRYFDELNYEEIARMLGKSTGTLKANYFFAVQKLTEFLKDEKN